jgi:hypothetical protein
MGIAPILNLATKKALKIEWFFKAFLIKMNFI